MKILQTGFLLSVMITLAACSMPGMKFEEGGSRVWQSESEGRGFNDDDAKLGVYEISPAMLAHLAADPARKSLSKPPLKLSRTNWEYRVGIGDVLSVIVWGHPELTNPAGTTTSVSSSGRVVRPDGSIFYPHVGAIQVAGQTVETIRLMIRDGLAPTIENPQVDVRVIEFRSQYVNIVGDVEQPCRLTVTDAPLTLVEAMNKCPTIRPAVGNRSVLLARGGGHRKVDLHNLYRGQDPQLNQPLQGGDTIYVQENRYDRIFVVGEVNNQATIDIPISGLTLADALNNESVRGVNQETADASELYVFRGGMESIKSDKGQVVAEEYRPKIFHLNAKSPDALLLADQFRLEPRDIVYVSTSALVSYSRATDMIVPTVNSLLQTGILIDGFGD